MSSFFDESSLCLIPSGYKDQKIYSVKPLDGSGDLTFSRASSATRVASNGLIEKVRTQQYYKSTAMIASSLYLTYGVVPTSLGTYPVYSDSLAYRWLNAIENQGASFVLPSDSAPRVFSVFTKDFGSLGGGSFYYSGGGGGSLTGYTTTEVINGYTRIYIPIPAGTSGTLFCRANDNTGGTFFMTAPQLEYGDYPTAYISNDTTASVVSVGPVSGLPRLDYLNSTCPRLLLEPQRTNLVTYSEQFDNAAWVKTQCTITANQTTSPDGTTNADLYTDGTFTGGTSFVDRLIDVTGNIDHTISIFVKKGTANYVTVGLYDNQSNFIVVNTNTWTVSGGSGDSSRYAIQNYGSGWYRISLTRNITTTAAYPFFGVSNNATNSSYNGTASLTAYFYGAQLEAGAYATSYIPTLGTSVTRVADAASKTGISSLIGQTEGTLFLDFVYKTPQDINSGQIGITNSSSPYDRVILWNNSTSNTLAAIIQVNGSSIFNTSLGTFADGQRYKIVIAYKSGSNAVYVNGTQVFTNANTFTFASTMTEFILGTYQSGLAPHQLLNQALIFPTRLTNAQLAELTTI